MKPQTVRDRGRRTGAITADMKTDMKNNKHRLDTDMKNNKHALKRDSVLHVCSL
jgi:hypothetical protein